MQVPPLDLGGQHVLRRDPIGRRETSGLLGKNRPKKILPWMALRVEKVFYAGLFGRSTSKPAKKLR